MLTDVDESRQRCAVAKKNKTARYGFLPEWSPKTIDELLESSDVTLFKAALKIPTTSYTHSSHLLKHPVTT